MSLSSTSFDVAVVGAGSIGVSIAYYLKKHQPDLRVALVDQVTPLSLTSARSGENYRNWWPHPIMKQFMDRSITLMEEISRNSDNAVRLSRLGYLLATRDSSPDALLENLGDTYSEHNELRFRKAGDSYSGSLTDPAVTGVDVLPGASFIQSLYPYFDSELQTLVHIRHAGIIDTQQLGVWMLSSFKHQHGQLVRGKVVDIQSGDDFRLHFEDPEVKPIVAEKIVNAAGPFVEQICELLGVQLPVFNVLQQKIAFEDTAAAIERDMPFAIDLDSQTIDWTEDEREALQQDPDVAYLLQAMTGSIHCRPEGSRWIKLGWAFNTEETQPELVPALFDYFPEIVIRGASRMLPALRGYLDGLPRASSHYGGYYTMTEENWPLIGETSVSGLYIAGAMSGFGSMAACATGELVSQTVLGLPTEAYASSLSMSRYSDASLMTEIQGLQSKGIL